MPQTMQETSPTTAHRAFPRLQPLTKRRVPATSVENKPLSPEGLMATSFTQLAENVVVSGNSAAVVSQAVSMNGANAVQANVVITALSTGTVTVAVQGSNDLENWSAITTSNGSSLGIGYHSPSAGDIAWQYVRLSYLNSGASTTILSAGVSTASL